MTFKSGLLSAILLFILTFSEGSLAFINIESIRQISGEGFVGRTGLQITGQDGNTNKFTSQLTLLTAYRSDNNEWIFTGDYKYGESFYRKDTNLGSAHIRHTWGYTNPLAYETFVQSGFNEFQELNSRNYFGGNLRFSLSEDGQSRFYLGTGAFYEIEDFSSAEDREGIRGNFYLSYLKKLNELITGSGIIYYQPLFKNAEQLRVRAQLGVDIVLTKSLILDIDLNVAHNTGLPPGVKETDIDYLLGVSLKF